MPTKTTKVEFVGGPLDGYFHDCPALESDLWRATAMNSTVMATIGKSKTLDRRQKVALYRLTERAGTYKYLFQAEMIYQPNVGCDHGR